MEALGLSLNLLLPKPATSGRSSWDTIVRPKRSAAVGVRVVSVTTSPAPIFSGTDWKRRNFAAACTPSSSSAGDMGDEEEEKGSDPLDHGSSRVSDNDSRDGGNDEMRRALEMDGSIPGYANEFLRQVSSRAYDMRRHLNRAIDSISYDVLETNPWREDSKPVYVLTQRENQLWTMKTRRNRSEVERELGLLFSKMGKVGSESINRGKHSRAASTFHLLVEDIREGVLVFEDERDATKYCDVLQGGGQGCDGIAELEASSVFDICSKMRALAVLFRRGRTPPLPESLEQNLRGRKHSLED